MTPQETNASGSAAPAKIAEDGAPIVTKEMIDAAAKVLWDSGLIENPIEADKVTIYRALYAALLAGRI